MSDAGRLLRSLYEAYQRRDWEACAPLLHSDAIYDLPRTQQHFEGGAVVLDYQRTYPEPWGELSVLRIVADGDQAAAEIAVTGGQEGDYRMAAFWTVRDGQLWRGVEYWIPMPSAPADSAASRLG
jgi:ketosteroid isomerase-like protein